VKFFGFGEGELFGEKIITPSLPSSISRFEFFGYTGLHMCEIAAEKDLHGIGGRMCLKDLLRTEAFLRVAPHAWQAAVKAPLGAGIDVRYDK